MDTSKMAPMRQLSAKASTKHPTEIRLATRTDNHPDVKNSFRVVIRSASIVRWHPDFVLEDL